MTALGKPATVLSTLGALPFALLTSLAAAGPRLAYYVAGILVAATGIGIGNVVQVTLRQIYCPARILGRVTTRCGSWPSGPAHSGHLRAVRSPPG